MSDVEITVRGSYTAYAPPQRATLRATVGIEGPSPEPVYRQAAKSAQALTDDITRVCTTRRPVRSPGGPAASCAPGPIVPGTRKASCGRLSTTPG